MGNNKLKENKRNKGLRLTHSSRSDFEEVIKIKDFFSVKTLKEFWERSFSELEVVSFDLGVNERFSFAPPLLPLLPTLLPPLLPLPLLLPLLPTLLLTLVL